MFFSQIILAKKGPLGKLWLAAHFDKKLTKTQIFATDISESVDSVLNSSNPLALRVSGHLMLGIVRIYSRKVKYLMSDCTEAMWKIKLAFRPGNVNLNESQLAVLNQIDDQRYFGRINPDTDFPELEDAGFSETMLMNDATLKAARGRSLATRSETLQDYDLHPQGRFSNTFSSPSFMSHGANDSDYYFDLNENDNSGVNFAYSDEKRQRSLGNNDNNDNINLATSNSSKASSIEKARHMQNMTPSSLNGPLNRFSYTGVAANMAMNFDEDIPAFEDNFEPGGFSAPRDSVLPTIHDQDEMQFENADDYPTGNDDQAISNTLSHSEGEQQQQLDEEEEGNENAAPANKLRRTEKEKVQEGDNEKGKEQKTSKRKKKQRIVVDDRIELSNKACKEMLEDISGIVRRRPEDPLVSQSPYFQQQQSRQRQQNQQQQQQQLTSSLNLCSELQEVFDMAIARDVPFASLSLADDASASVSGSVQPRASTADDIERTRKNKTMTPLNANTRPSFIAPSDALDGLDNSGDDRFQYSDDVNGYEPPMMSDEYNSDDKVVDMPSLHEYGFATSSPAVRMDSTHRLSALMGTNSNNNNNNKPDATPSDTASINQLNRYSVADASVANIIVAPEGNNPDKWNARTKVVLDILKTQFDEQPVVSFDSLANGATRRAAAACFLEVLQLKTWGILDVSQTQPFADIEIQATQRLWDIQQQ